MITNFQSVLCRACQSFMVPHSSFTCWLWANFWIFSSNSYTPSPLRALPCPSFHEKVEAMDGTSLMSPPSNHRSSLELCLCLLPRWPLHHRSGPLPPFRPSHELDSFRFPSLHYRIAPHLLLLGYSHHHTNRTDCLQYLKVSLFTLHPLQALPCFSVATEFHFWE